MIWISKYSLWADFGLVNTGTGPPVNDFWFGGLHIVGNKKLLLKLLEYYNILILINRLYSATS